MDRALLSTAEKADLLGPLEQAMDALARLEASVARSPVGPAWEARAHIHGLARMLAMGGVPLTPAEFFRGLVGLVERSAWQHFDWRAISVAQTLFSDAHPAQGPIGVMLRPDRHAGHLLTADWLDELDTYRAATSEVLAGWREAGASLVALGLSLHEALRTPLEGWSCDDRLDHLYRMTGYQPEAPWVGWLLAPHLSARIASATGGRPLPCLVPLRRSMRFTTQRPADTVKAFLDEVAMQAAAGQSLLERLEACATVWRSRLGSPTARSRLAAAAALLLILPVVTRHQMAREVGVTPAGAGDLLARLADADIVRVHSLSPRNVFHVADESLGDFKLEGRQGRQPAPPALASAEPTLDDLAVAMAEIDRLLAAKDS